MAENTWHSYKLGPSSSYFKHCLCFLPLLDLIYRLHVLVLFMVSEHLCLSAIDMLCVPEATCCVLPCFATISAICVQHFDLHRVVLDKRILF